MKILIIEDEILIQKSIIKLLEKRGLNCVGCSSGKEGISLIKEVNFDRVICDLMLKDITGFEVIEESKNKYTTDEISNLFIIMTAYSSEHILKNASRYKCPIIHKPFNDIEDIINLITNGNNQ